MLSPQGYRARVVDDRVEALLQVFGAVSIDGCKWCGKTWTSLTHANSVYYVGDPAGNFRNRQLAELDGRRALIGEKPHAIDEWSEVPGLWDAVRFAVDQAPGPGHYILTGSSVPPKNATMHSGIGRIARVRMRPMSLAESGDSSCEVSLRDLFLGASCVGHRTVTLDDIIAVTVRGGWPQSLGLSRAASIELPRQYVEAIVSADISRVDGVKRDASRASRLLASLARNTMTQSTAKTLRADTADGRAETGMAERTLASYLGALRRLYVVEDLPAWMPGLRSSTRLRVSPKRHFVDPSLAVAALGATAATLLDDLNTFGFIFENLVVRDLKIYTEPTGGRVSHYRDDDGLEVDAIVETVDGQWAGIEVKLGAAAEDSAAATLKRLRDKLVTRGVRPPAFLAVICGVSDDAYTRRDGVHVIPITTLGA